MEVFAKRLKFAILKPQSVTDLRYASLRIVIADDHPLFRAALKQAVSKAAKQVDIVEVSTMAELQDAASEHNDADLVLLDLTMPGASGFSSLVYLKGQSPEMPVVVVSGNEDHSVIRRSIEYGALGFIPKSGARNDG